MDGLERYFDHAATTPIHPSARDAVLRWLVHAGNPSSLHSPGVEARAAVEAARETLAGVVGAEDPSQITFTSGATEGANAVLRSLPPGEFSPFEHAAVREPAEALGWRAMANSGHDLFPALPIRAVTAVSNETGGVYGTDAGFSDASQALGRIRFAVGDLDHAVFCGHKCGGPVGIGATYSRLSPPEPLIVGGGHENGARAGTLATPLIAGFAEAARIAAEEREEREEHARALAAILRETLNEGTGWTWVEPPRRTWQIVLLLAEGLQGETIALEADVAGFAVSAGPACSAGSNEPSPGLLALGYPAFLARGAVRVSFGPVNTRDSAAALARTLGGIAARLRRMSSPPEIGAT